MVLNRKYIYLFLMAYVFSVLPAYSQSGMRFEELAKKLESYFAAELIDDVKSQLPQGSDYKVWGWDIGDFSGDGYNDLALSIKVSAEKKKVNDVYLFVDIDGFLTNVSKFSFDYVELPLEIGVVIRYNTCYVTKKREQFSWIIKGYRFDNGVLFLEDVFETEKIGKYTYEKNTNYQTLKNTEKYIVNSNNETVFYTNFLAIPSFNRSRLIYKGYQSETKSNFVDYVLSGAYWWKGDTDCAFSVASAYNDKELYFTLSINDESIIDQLCDTCEADYVEVWFDTSPQTRKGNRFVERKGDNLKFRKQLERGIFSFKIFPGDFKTKKAFVKDISTTDKLYEFQKNEISTIKAVSTIKEGGYVIKFKIPFLLFGFNKPPESQEEIFELGCTVVVNDMDNEFRPEELTRLATSELNPTDPSSYGSILLIPANVWYGSVVNVFKDDIVKVLNEYGY